MNDITLRVREVFNTVKKSQSDFAREINVTPAYVWKLLNKDDAIPSDRLIEDICEKFRINEDWLRTGQGKMLLKLSRKDELVLWASTALKSESEEFRNRFVDALSKLDTDDWELLANMAETLVKQREKIKD